MTDTLLCRFTHPLATSTALMGLLNPLALPSCRSYTTPHPPMCVTFPCLEDFELCPAGPRTSYFL